MVGAIDISVAVLVVSAIMKLTDPSATAMLLSSLGVSRPGRPAARLARLSGAAELGAATAMVVLGGRIPAVVLALTYAALSGVLAVVIRSGARPGTPGRPAASRPISCGCFGARSAPPTRLHLVLNLTSVAAAIAAIVVPVDPLATRLTELGLAAAPYLVLVAVGAGLVIAAHTVGAELSAELTAEMSSTGRPLPRRRRAGT